VPAVEAERAAVGAYGVSGPVTAGGRVTVYGSNVLRPPLCDDSDAKLVVVRNSAGDPMILLYRLAGDDWGLSTPDDKDWVAICVRLGLMRPLPAADVLANARSVKGSH